MATINRLSSVTAVSGADQVPIYSSENGDARKASVNAVKEYIQDNFVPAGGVLAIAALSTMVIQTPVNVNVGLAFANIPNWAAIPGVVPPSDSVAPMVALGEFVAQRDIAAVEFYFALNGTWPTNRDLYLSVFAGGYESAFSFVGAGRGPGAPVSVALCGIAANLNNPNGIILAGERIKIMAKMSVADVLAITKMALVIKTLDGL